MNHSLRRQVAVSLILSLIFVSVGTADDKEPTFVKFLTNGKNQVVAGLLGRESETHIEVVRLDDGEGVTFKKADVRQIRKNISEQELVAGVGLPSYLAWRIHRSVPPRVVEGAIAKVDAAAVYVTTGLNAGVKEGHELRVYRGSSEVKDPVSGEVIGKERRLIAKLTVFESRGTFAKAKLQGDLEVALEVGDSVEPSNSNDAIVILPFVDSDSRETQLGKELSEALITSLVKRKVAVVERNLIDKVLGELAIQQTALFDSASAQRVGKQIGGFAILSGTIAEADANSDIQVRLVEIETGRVLFSVSSRAFGKGLGERLSSRASVRPAPKGTKVIAHWGFEGKFTDSVEPRRLEGRKSGEVEFVPGKSGKAIHSDGFGYVRVPHDERLDLWGKDFSITFWLKADDVEGHEGQVLAKGEYNKRGWIVDVSANRKAGAIRMETIRVGTSMNQEVVSASGTIKSGKWHFVCIAVKNEMGQRSVKLHVDDELVAQGSIASGQLDSEDHDLVIDRMAASVDEVTIFEGAIDPDADD